MKAKSHLSSLIVVLLLMISVCDSSLYGDIDLEEMTQDYIIESKRIIIPGHLNAFNPSIIRWQGKLLMSFREVPYSYMPYISHLGLVWLDEDFNVISEAKMLTFGDLLPSRLDDLRLVQSGEKLYIVYSNNPDLVLSAGGFRVQVAELMQFGDSFHLRDVHRLTQWDGEQPGVREKNWVPFDFRGQLMLAYSIIPHRVLTPRWGTERCDTVDVTRSAINWSWGELRGGTPALLDGGEYLAIFHSLKKMTTVHSTPKEMPHYFMGAYTFSAEPPFNITKVSQSPIIGENFYHGPKYSPYWGSVRVVFPCGILIDENYVWVSYGRQDHECWIVKMDKKKLMESLVPVPPLEIIDGGWKPEGSPDDEHCS